MHIHLDAIGGMAGDMFVAAALDTWPEWQDGLFAALHRCGLPPGWQPRLEPARQHAIQGRQFSILPPAPSPSRGRKSGVAHEHGQDDDSGTFRTMRANLLRSELDQPVKEHAIGILTLLAQAEAAIHGVPIEEVHFHELADWDSLADIVAAAWVITRACARSWSISALPLGSGTVETAHGSLPVPAPATVRLLQGFEVRDDGLPGERVTPTGAAILRYVAPVSRQGMSGRLWRSGHGLGTRHLPDRANILRLLALEGAEPATEPNVERIAVLSFDIDDQSSEDLAVALDHMRTAPGVADVTLMAVFGKKGRIVQRVQVLCTPEAAPAVCQQSFVETTTTGLRWHLEWRQMLARTQSEREGIRVKRAYRPDGRVTAKAEIEDVRNVLSHSERCLLRASAEHTNPVKVP
jgi:pyridinium-3,5-bisthiocarboxylic acid mononucleotide nickel chelatase